MEKIETILVVVLGIYELLSRVVPTNKTWSIIGIVLKAAKALSDFFDNKKK